MKDSVPSNLETIDAPTVWNTLDVFVTEYVRDYEMCDCEDENGNTGDYSPNENESALIDDAIQGLLADDDFMTLMGKAYLARQEQRKAEGKCLGCGGPDGIHWGQRPECGAGETALMAPGHPEMEHTGECSCKGHPFNCFSHPHKCGCLTAETGGTVMTSKSQSLEFLTASPVTHTTKYRNGRRSKPRERWHWRLETYHGFNFEGHGPDKDGWDTQVAAIAAGINAMTAYFSAETCSPRPDAEALAAVPDLKGKNAVVLYFDTDQDREEFVAMVHEAKPGMRAVNL